MNNRTTKNIVKLIKDNFTRNLFRIIVICILVLSVYAIIYFTGGKISSLLHLSYIPILLSTVFFNTKVGVIVSIIVGIMVGPVMSPNIGTYGVQNTISWMFRIIMFIIISLLFGLLFSHVKKINELEKRKAFEDVITGYPNYNKLRYDLTNIISNKQINFSLIVFEFNNLEMINKYIDYETGQKSYNKLLKMAHDFFDTDSMYIISFNKFIVYIQDYNKDELYSLSSEFLYTTKNSIFINEFPISIILKCGILNYPLHCHNIKDIYIKIEKVIEQANKTQNDIVIYNNNLFDKDDSYYNTLITLYDDLKNDKFTIVYQPQINLDTNEIIGAEALLRINSTYQNDLSIEQFIKMAEDAGFIKEVSKWVINYVLNEQKKLLEDGIEIKISVNLSPMDLNDDFFFEYAKEKMEQYNISPSLVEFELTERIIIVDEKKAFELFNKIKDFGIKLALDDYGAGYNSFRHILNHADIFDYIKIDKSYINSIDDDKIKLVIKGIIEIANGLGIETVAEGVEKIEQIEILKSIGCNIAQGYYLSEPLNLMNLKTFIESNRVY